MKAANLREQTDEELRNQLEEARKELGTLRLMRRAGDGSTSPIRARGLRRTVAKVLTVMRERESGATAGE
jgi:ribosomal protein L29